MLQIPSDPTDQTFVTTARIKSNMADDDGSGSFTELPEPKLSPQSEKQLLLLLLLDGGKHASLRG